MDFSVFHSSNMNRPVILAFPLIFGFLLIPWALAIRYNRDRTPKPAKHRKEVVENANNYRRYPEYTVLIVVYATVLAAYVCVLDRAVKDSEFLGKDPERHNTNFQVLSFFRTGFTVIHLPLLTSISAATVPYWTMAKSVRSTLETAAEQLSQERLNQQEQQRTRVAQLFYLADRSWAGLIGWSYALIYGWKQRAFSFIWVQLAIIALLAYIGFPLLSLAYVTKNTQYWVSNPMSATVDVGGMSQSYNDALKALQDRDLWMGGRKFRKANLNAGLVGFNSSGDISSSETTLPSFSNTPPPLFGKFIDWADNHTFSTVVLPKTDDSVQLPVAGIKAFATCRKDKYSLADITGENNTGMRAVQNTQNDSNSDGPSFTLLCNNGCFLQNNISAMACNRQSSKINVTSFSYRNASGYEAGVRNNKEQPEHPDIHLRYEFSNISSTAEGQALSCIEQEFSNSQSTANILLAVQAANNITEVATCELSITYMKPTVNTLLGKYIESTASSSAVLGLSMTPVELLNLSMASFVHFFHEGPPNITYQPPATKPLEPECVFVPITDGFNWVSSWVRNVCYKPQLMGSANITTHTNATTLLERHSDYITGLTVFDERVFLAPLASFINDPSFFRNGSVTGVTFKVQNGLAYGRVPPALALVVLAIPILWTIALSVVTTTRRRWTASLDAFAMFKLGADWHGEMKDLRLASLGKANEQVMLIPGTVMIEPETGRVELGNAQKRQRVSKEERNSAWNLAWGFDQRPNKRLGRTTELDGPAKS